MDDLISRQAAIDELNGQIEYCDKALRAFDIAVKDEYAVKAERASLMAFKEKLENIPAADAAPVVHGKWIPQDHNKRIGCATIAVFYYPKCSACGHNGNYDMHYCPNCGAKMDGERKE